VKWFSKNWIYNFKSYAHNSLYIESLAYQNLLVNDAVVRKEIREVVILSTEGNKVVCGPQSPSQSI
jgi:hypothetical protein